MINRLVNKYFEFSKKEKKVLVNVLSALGKYETVLKLEQIKSSENTFPKITRALEQWFVEHGISVEIKPKHKFLGTSLKVDLAICGFRKSGIDQDLIALHFNNPSDFASNLASRILGPGILEARTSQNLGIEFVRTNKEDVLSFLEIKYQTKWKSQLVAKTNSAAPTTISFKNFNLNWHPSTETQKQETSVVRTVQFTYDWKKCDKNGTIH